jgi:type IV secretion system protein VirB10
MTERAQEPGRDEPDHGPARSSETPDTDEPLNTLSPFPGEAGIPDLSTRRRQVLSGKGLLAAGVLIGGLIGVSAFSIERFTTSAKKPGDGASQRVSDRPAAATAEPRHLDVTPAGHPNTPVAFSASSPRIPALVPTADEAAEPIGVHRTGKGPAGSDTHANAIAPEDAPVLLVSARPGTAPRAAHSRDESMADVDTTTSSGTGDSTTTGDPPAPDDPLATTTRSLQGYQRQLQGMLDTLNRRTAASTGAADATAFPGTGLATGVLPAGNGGPGLPTSLARGAPARVMATRLEHRSLTLPQGTAFTCALKTKVISATSGPVTCQVQRNVYGDDGRVLLVERGSHLDGDYRIASVKPGTVRIPVVWTRLRTPQGVVVDLDSPGTGPLGEAGIDGYVDNRWGERIGAALLLSLIDDSVQMVIQEQASSQGNNGQTNTVLLPSTTANTNKLAEKVLDSTINIPPLIYQNQGGIVGIVVAHDIDFSSVYALRPSALEPAAGRAPAPLADAASGAAQ